MVKAEVLIVENHKPHAMLLEINLNKAEISTEIAENLADAYTKIRNGNYKVVICDTKVNDELGYELKRRLLGEDDVTPFIALSASAENQHYWENLGVKFFLKEEIAAEPKKLVELVRGYL